MNVSPEIVEGINRSLTDAMGDSVAGTPDSVVMLFARGRVVLAVYDIPEGARPEESARKLHAGLGVLPGISDEPDESADPRATALFAALKHHRDMGAEPGTIVATAETFYEFLCGGAK